MKLSISNIMALKQELQSQFEAKATEQKYQLEESIKSQTYLAFAELSSFFSQLSQFKSESEIASMHADRTASDSFIKTQIANVVIGFASLFQNQKDIQSAKLQEYLNQKNDIEQKIDQLKKSISDREANLNALEGKIANITTATSNPGTAANVSMAEIKSIQASLEQTQKQTIESVKNQKEVSNELKEVAVQKVNKEVDKVKEKTKEAITTEKNKNAEVMDNQSKQLTFDFFETSKQTVDKATESSEKKDTKETTTQPPATQPPATQPDEAAPPAKDPNQLELPFDQPAATQTPPAQQPDSQNPPTQGTQTTLDNFVDPAKAKQMEQQTKDDKGDAKVKEASNAATQSIDEGKKLLETDTNLPNPATVATPDPENPGLPVTITAQAKTEEVKQTVIEATQNVAEVKQVTDKLTDQVDKKLDVITDTLASSQVKLDDNKDKVSTQNDGNTMLGIAGAAGIVNTQSEDIKQTAANLKDVHQQQKDILEAQKESIAVLEESKEKLIGKDTAPPLTTTNAENKATNNVIQDIVADATTTPLNAATQSANIVNQALAQAEQQKELNLLQELKRRLENLMNKIKDIIDSMLGKEKVGDKRSIDDAIQQVSSDKNSTDAFSHLQNDANTKENKVAKTGNEIFFISSQITDVDKVMDNYLELAQKTEKIIVDRNLTDVYEALSTKLGKDKVILDRRGQDDRRTVAPRRSMDELLPSSEEKKSIDKEMEKRSNDDRRAKNERRQADLSIIQELDDLDVLLDAKENNMA